MPLIEINWNPEEKELRKFGVIALVATVIIALLLYFVKGIAIRWVSILPASGFIIFLCSTISIRLTRLIYLGLTMVTMPIGIVVSFLVLAIFYFVLLMPVGLFFRLIGRDLLDRNFKSDRNSYWTKHQPVDKMERYFRQF